MTDQLGELYRISIQHVGRSNASREWRVIFDNVPVANNVTFLTVYQVKQGGDYNAKMGNHYWTMPLEQWRKYVSYRVNDTKR